MQKILTVSIAAYNVEKYLEQTLQSLIVEKNMQKLEVLIINDGSKDSTEIIAKSFVDSYPDTFILLNKINGGWGSTVNTGIKNASGKYFKILDGDDWFDTVNLDKFIEYLETTDSDLIFTQYMQIYEGSKKVKLIEQNLEYNKQLNVSTIDNICMHALTVRTELLQKNNIHLLEQCFYTDTEFFVKAAINAENLISIPLNIYCYRLGREGQSVSLSGYLRHMDEHKRVTDVVLSIVYSNNKLTKLQETLNIAMVHVGLFLYLEPSINNLNEFIAYKKYLKKYYPQAIVHMSLAVKLAFYFPKLFYKTICRLKRKKYGVK